MSLLPQAEPSTIEATYCHLSEHFGGPKSTLYVTRTISIVGENSVSTLSHLPPSFDQDTELSQQVTTRVEGRGRTW